MISRSELSIFVKGVRRRNAMKHGLPSFSYLLFVSGWDRNSNLQLFTSSRTINLFWLYGECHSQGTYIFSHELLVGSSVVDVIIRSSNVLLSFGGRMMLRIYATVDIGPVSSHVL